MSNPSYVIKGARIVKPLRVLEGDIQVDSGIISYIGESRPRQEGKMVLNAAGKYVIPGFIDLHMHGGMGFDLTEGKYDAMTRQFDASPERYAEGLPALARRLLDYGTTRAVPATVAAPIERLEYCLGELGRYIHSDRNGHDGALLHGALVEGTFIRHDECAGAQNPEHFRTPSVDLYERLQAAAEGTIAAVNVPPEWGRPALDLIDRVVADGRIAAAGHSRAPADLYDEAARHGLSLALHFTNGPTGSSLKPFGGGGMLQAVLGSRRIYAELIADGYHVNPAYVLDIIRRKGIERVLAVSDSMFPLDAVGIEQFEVAGVTGCLSSNGEYLEVVGKENTLFGLVLKMKVAFSNIVSWLTRRMPGIWNDEHLPMDTEEAILSAMTMCSINPAKVLGIFDPPDRWVNQDISVYTGGLQVGKRADLQVVRLIGQPGAYDIDIEQVFQGGRLVT